MSTAVELPPEILLIIFSYFYADSLNLSRFEVVSKSWHAPARATLYQHVQLLWSEVNVELLQRSLKKDTSLFGFINSLSITAFTLDDIRLEVLMTDWVNEWFGMHRDTYDWDTRIQITMTEEEVEAKTLEFARRFRKGAWLTDGGRREALDHLVLLLKRCSGLRSLRLERFSSDFAESTNMRSRMPELNMVLEGVEELTLLRMDSDVGSDFLRRCPNLTSLQVDTAQPFIPSFPFLRHLSAEPINQRLLIQIFQSESLARSLQTLDIAFDDLLQYAPADGLVLPHVSHVRVKMNETGWSVFEEYKVNDFFNQLPNVRHITFANLHWSVYSSLLWSPLNPKLEVIEMSIDNDEDGTPRETGQDLISHLLETLWEDGGTALRRFDIHHWPGLQLAEPTEGQKATLDEKGLEVRFFSGLEGSPLFDENRIIDLWEAEQRSRGDGSLETLFSAVAL